MTTTTINHDLEKGLRVYVEKRIAEFEDIKEVKTDFYNFTANGEWSTENKAAPKWFYTLLAEMKNLFPDADPTTVVQQTFKGIIMFLSKDDADTD